MKKSTFNKISISALSIVTTASIAGAITGTVAWFQYSTRAQAAFTGTTVHCSENLRISIDGNNWKTELNSSETQQYLLNNGREDTALRPVTTGEHKKNEKINGFKRNPIYQYNEMENWIEADESDYVTFPLRLKVVDVNGKQGEYLLAKKIYLSDLTIVTSSNNPAIKYDITDALRVHYDIGDFHATIANQEYNVNTYGPLDLDGDTKLDMSEGYDFTDGRSILQYGLEREVKGIVEDDEHMPANPSEGDVYYFVEYKEYKEYKESAFESLKLNAESYSNKHVDNNSIIADDSNPNDIKGQSIGSTVNAVPTFNELPGADLEANQKDVRKVTSENKNYEWNGSAWVVSEEAATTKAQVNSVQDLITVSANDVYYARNNNLLYKYNGSAWEIDADEEVDTLPSNLPSIGDSYYVTSADKNYTWNGSSWVEVEVENNFNAIDELPGNNVYGKRYYLSTDKKFHRWSGNGDVWSIEDKDLDVLKIDVTIYLEGWSKLASKGTVASKEALPNAATYIDVDKSYHIGEDEERVNYRWDGSSWVVGGEGSDGVIERLSDLPNIGDSYRSLADGKTYVLTFANNAFSWEEGEGSAIWDDLNYVQSSFNIGMRFSSELHTTH